MKKHGIETPTPISAHQEDDTIVSSRNELLNDQEILSNTKAQSILPYLTLNRLSEHETANLLKLSDEVIVAMDSGHLPEDAFLSISELGAAIANVSSESSSWSKGRITPKLEQARKLVCASLLDEMDSNTRARNQQIYDSFFSFSPGLSSYCGGLSDSLELLTIAERAGPNPNTDNTSEEIILESSFAKENDFEEVLKESTPIQQLRFLPIYNNLALRCDTSGYSSRALNKITTALNTAINDEQTKPLIRLMASAVDDNIKQFHNSDWIEINEDSPEYQEDISRREAWKKEQSKLHKDYPSLPNHQILSIIAPNTAAVMGDDGNITQISNKNGDELSLLSCPPDNKFNLDRNAAFLLSAAHNPGVEQVISDKIGLDLSEIPLDAQVHLLKFMTEADSGRFDKLCNTLNQTDEKLRLKLAKNFVATGFGDDFGDSLLDITDSEKLSNTEKERLLDTVEKCRESIERITGLYTEFDDGKFAKEYAKASNERLTDALAVFRQIAKSGTAEADLDWAGHPHFNYDSALEALKYEAKSLEIISGTLHNVSTGAKGSFAEVVLTPDKSYQRLNRTFYNFYSPQHGYVLLYTRPEGSHSFDPMIEFGKERSKYREDSINAGVEASISLTTNPIDPFSLPNPYRPDKRAVRNPRFYDPDTMDKVSAIRLDREGRAPGTEANDALRDPINPIGMVSVDLAAIGDRADTPSGKIARLLSVGGKLREEMSGVASSLNHNTKWFEQDVYGTAEGFSELVGYIDSIALEWCQKVPPERDAESFSRRKRQALGRKARKIA